MKNLIGANIRRRWGMMNILTPSGQDVERYSAELRNCEI